MSVVFSVMQSELSSAVSSVNATVMDMLKLKNKQVASGQEVFIIYIDCIICLDNGMLVML